MPWQLLNLYPSSPKYKPCHLPNTNLVGGGKPRALTSGAFEDLKEALNVTDRNHHPPPLGQLSVVFLRTTNGAQIMYSLKTKELFSYVHVYV